MEKHGIVRGKQFGIKRQKAKALRREMTPAEASLWEQLRRNQCGGLHFRRQQVIDGFIADFYCHAIGLVVEVDGGIHDQQAEYDAQRDSILSARGLTILRFTNEQIHSDLSTVLSAIQAIARSPLP